MGRITGYFYLTMITETTMYRLSLTPSSIAFSYDSNGKLTGSQSVKIGLTEHKGDEIIKHTSEPTSLWTYRGWDGVADSFNGFNPITVNATDAAAHESVTVEIWKGNKNGAGSVMLDSASVPIVKEGKPGKPGEPGNKGAKMRMRDWSSYTSYLSGVGSEVYYDVVVYDKRLYLCLKSHTSNSTPPPQSITNHEGLWEVAQNWAFVATKLLLTEKIHADQIDCSGTTSTNKLVAKGADIQGTITSEEGKIGGYRISRAGFQSDYSNNDPYYSSSNTSSGSMILNEDYLRFTERNSSGTAEAILGKRAISSIFSVSECPFYVKSVCTNFQIEPTIGLMVSAQGSRVYDDVQNSGNHALYIPYGDICGLRRKTKRIQHGSETIKNVDVSTMDSVLVCITADKKDISLNLPTDAEDGQEYYFIHVGTGGWMHMKARNTGYSIKCGGETKNEFISSKIMEKCHLLYDAPNKVWFLSFM